MTCLENWAISFASSSFSGFLPALSPHSDYLGPAVVQANLVVVDFFCMFYKAN